PHHIVGQAMTLFAQSLNVVLQAFKVRLRLFEDLLEMGRLIRLPAELRLKIVRKLLRLLKVVTRGLAVRAQLRTEQRIALGRIQRGRDRDERYGRWFG